MIDNYDRNFSFMVLDTVITIVNYDRHMFIVQATCDAVAGVIALNFTNGNAA